jgi:transposase
MPSSRNPAPTSDGPDTVFLALELSGTSWLVALHAPDADKVERHRLASGQARDLLDLIARIRSRVQRRLGTVPRVSCCYEAGRDGFWLHRLLEREGIASHVMDPTSLQVDRRARRAKTDRLDAEALLRALMAWSRGERRVCSMVRPPSPEQEDARRPSREREALLKERIRRVNRIKGLCAAQGVYDYEPIQADRRERLAQLVTGDGRPLPRELAAEIGRQLEQLELVLRQLAEVEAVRDQRAAAARAEPGSKLGALLRLRGIGPELATVLQMEVFYRHFASRRDVAAYAGLAPSPFASGGRQREQGIAKAGNPRARKALVELAWLWLRHQPESALARWFRDRVGTAGGRACAAYRHRRIGAAAPGRLVAVCRDRRRAHGGTSEGLTGSRGRRSAAVPRGCPRWVRDRATPPG